MSPSSLIVVCQAFKYHTNALQYVKEKLHSGLCSLMAEPYSCAMLLALVPVEIPCTATSSSSRVSFRLLLMGHVDGSGRPGSFMVNSWLCMIFVSWSCCSAWESAFEIPGERQPKEQQAVKRRGTKHAVCCLCRMEWSSVAGHVCPLFWEGTGASAPVTPVCPNIQEDPCKSTGKTGLLLKQHSVFLTVFLKENSKQEGPDLKPYWWDCHSVAGVLLKETPPSNTNAAFAVLASFQWSKPTKISPRSWKYCNAIRPLLAKVCVFYSKLEVSEISDSVCGSVTTAAAQQHHMWNWPPSVMGCAGTQWRGLVTDRAVYGCQQVCSAGVLLAEKSMCFTVWHNELV